MAWCSRNDLRDRVERAAGMQRSGVLRGDYRLKIARQNYLTSKQDDMIGHLMSQRSRREVIAACHRVEIVLSNHTGALLQAAALTYQADHHQLVERLKVVNDIRAGASSDKRTASSGDVVVARIYALLKVG